MRGSDNKISDILKGVFVVVVGSQLVFGCAVSPLVPEDDPHPRLDEALSTAVSIEGAALRSGIDGVGLLSNEGDLEYTH